MIRIGIVRMFVAIVFMFTWELNYYSCLLAFWIGTITRVIVCSSNRKRWRMTRKSLEKVAVEKLHLSVRSNPVPVVCQENQSLWVSSESSLTSWFHFFFSRLYKELELLPKAQGGSHSQPTQAGLAPVDDDSEDVAHANRGIAYIFNQMKFDPRLGLDPRPGTDEDASLLETTLRDLGFKVRVLCDKKFNEIKLNITSCEYSFFQFVVQFIQFYS
jgi:hypothetical protein